MSITAKATSNGSRLRNCISASIFFAALYVLYLTYEHGRVVGMPDFLHSRYWFYAFPVALSQLYFDLSGYIGYVKIYEHIAGVGFNVAESNTVNAVLQSASRVAHVDGAGTFLFPGDEKGIVDFIRLAFLLFGVGINSLGLKAMPFNYEWHLSCS
jgi:hypothetical protein